MKKIFMIIAIAAMSVSFVACGGSAAKEGENTTETTGSSSSNDIVAQYQTLCDKMVELSKKMQDGDTKAIEEYQKVAQDFANFAQNNQDAFAKLTPEEVQKIQDIAMKAAEAMQ